MVNHPINYSRGYCKSSLRRAIQKDKQQKREWFIALDPQFPSFPIVLLHENIKWPVYLRTICGHQQGTRSAPRNSKKVHVQLGMTKSPIYGQEFTAENLPVTSMFFPGKMCLSENWAPWKSIVYGNGLIIIIAPIY